MLLMQDLPKTDRELLESIIRKEKAALTESEKAVLKARRDYISKEVYQELIGDEPKKAQKVEDEKQPATNEPKKAQKVEDEKQPAADPFSVSEKKKI